MSRLSRAIIALVILLSGLSLVPQVSLFAGSVNWQRFAGGYEDVVTITLARYINTTSEGGNLEVRATTTAGASATLGVYRTSDNLFIGNLTWTGSDHYGLFAITPNPQNITVRSSAGGVASAPVVEVPSAVEVSTLTADESNNTLLAVGALALVAGLAVLATRLRKR